MLLVNVLSCLTLKLMDGKGQKKETDIKFVSETRIVGSCSIAWRGKMYVFGGEPFMSGQLSSYKKISIIDKCELKGVIVESTTLYSK